MLKRSRSEARFVRQLNKASTSREAALERGLVSVPVEDAMLAVIHSLGTKDESEYSAHAQCEIFEREAEAVAASQWAEQYDSAVVVPARNAADIDSVVKNKEVAGIVLIGHGTLSALRLMDNKYYIWHDAVRSVKTLKLGHFVQRMCGEVRVSNAAPLGTFVVADQRNIVAAPGVAVNDAHPDEARFVPVFDKPHNTTDDIIALRDRHFIKNKA